MKTNIKKQDTQAGTSSSLSIFFRGKLEKDNSSNDEGPGPGIYDEIETGGFVMNNDGTSNKFKRCIYQFYNKLKRNILWRISPRGTAFFLIFIYLVSRVIVPWIYEPIEDSSFSVPDELVAEGNEPYGLNFRFAIIIIV